AVQDGYQLYHHVLVFDRTGEWAVIQQGMNETNHWARRYHWLSSGVTDFVCEPHAAVCSDSRDQLVLNMVAGEAEDSRRTSAMLASEPPEKLAREIVRMQELTLPSHHAVLVSDLNPRSVERILLKAYERRPEDFRSLLEVRGVGPKTIRALAMIADLVYGSPASTRDPAKFSFAHGGKDGFPYPVNRRVYDRSIEVIKKAVELTHHSSCNGVSTWPSHISKTRAYARSRISSNSARRSCATGSRTTCLSTSSSPTWRYRKRSSASRFPTASPAWSSTTKPATITSPPGRALISPAGAS
ncbi:MAG: DUF763 domain-containing protein, partial [Armatimonadetes bacterium]|nr:DUF763 domain-containing protein [Armatimonadota bacterium]